MKIKTFCNMSDEYINEFLENKEIIDIKYFNDQGNEYILIMYEDNSQENKGSNSQAGIFGNEDSVRLGKSPVIASSPDTHSQIKDEIDENYDCNCGGIIGKRWSHESWCNSLDKKYAKEKENEK